MKKQKILPALLASFCLLLFVALMTYCTQNQEADTNALPQKKKIGVLLVNHGSRSETWRNALLALEKSVKDSILKGGEVSEIKTAFMEYTEPSIATRLREFDKEAYTDVIIVPVFLTVSPHSFDDIPTIIGQKEDPQSVEALKLEKIERYTPKAKTHLTPLLDFTDVLEKNILRRFSAISKDAVNEGMVLMAYGDVTYVREWSDLLIKVGKYIEQNTDLREFSYGWCGHIASYSADSTTAAIHRATRNKKNAVVIPVLVAHDEMFQVKIIGDGIAKIRNYKENVIYKPDAILPDPNIERWVINVVKDHVTRLNAGLVQK